jgi:hypothetical protein
MKDYLGTAPEDDAKGCLQVRHSEAPAQSINTSVLCINHLQLSMLGAVNHTKMVMSCGSHPGAEMLPSILFS